MISVLYKDFEDMTNFQFLPRNKNVWSIKNFETVVEMVSIKLLSQFNNNRPQSIKGLNGLRYQNPVKCLR